MSASNNEIASNPVHHFVRNPEELLRKPNCKAISLSVSDNHANLLLWNDIIEKDTSGNHVVVDEKHSLLKISVVPGHKDQLAVKKRITNFVDLEQATKKAKVEDCQTIIQFLSKLDFRLTSESGAEYSYYTAAEKSWWKKNPLSIFYHAMGWNEPSASSIGGTQFKLELISPATKRQIERSLPSPEMSLIEETPEIYTSIVEPFIQSIVDSGSLSWINNVIEGKKEVERLLFDSEDYIINVDTKWRSHPDCKIVPREEWFQHKSVEDLYCLAIVKDGGIRSLRDLREGHGPMLTSIVEEGQKVIESVYGVKKGQLRIFVHYQPQFYHFHVHFTRLDNEIGCQVERGHLVSDIIQNLLLDPEFYIKRTISFKVKTSSEIYFMIHKDEI